MVDCSGLRLCDLRFSQLCFYERCSVFILKECLTLESEGT